MDRRHTRSWIGRLDELFCEGEAKGEVKAALTCVRKKVNVSTRYVALGDVVEEHIFDKWDFGESFSDVVKMTIMGAMPGIKFTSSE